MVIGTLSHAFDFFIGVGELVAVVGGDVDWLFRPSLCGLR